jgi:hypothetical protein
VHDHMATRICSNVVRSIKGAVNLTGTLVCHDEVGFVKHAMLVENSCHCGAAQ